MTTTQDTTQTTQDITQADGLLAPTADYPWPLAPVSGFLIGRYLRACVARGVTYQLGAKAATLGRFPPDFDAVDCSGWVRAAVAYASDGALVLPDGSVRQREWCEGVGLKRSAYPALGLGDGVLRIAFVRPCAAHPVGHVLLCRDRETFESWGGHGPGSRSWLTHLLSVRITDVFVLSKER